MKRFFMKGIKLAVPALLAAAVAHADSLILRDGRRIEGRLVSVRDGIIEFEADGPFNGARTLRLSRSDVAGVEFGELRRSDGGAPQPFPQPAYGRRPSGLRERQVMVAANVQWVDTGIDVQSGQNVYFEASGEVGWGPGRRDGPAGEQNSPVNPNRPIPNRPGAALIGRVGERSSDYFYIGAERGPIRMRSSGRLFLGINDDYLQDNAGAFRVVAYY